MTVIVVSQFSILKGLKRHQNYNGECNHKYSDIVEFPPLTTSVSDIYSVRCHWVILFLTLFSDQELQFQPRKQSSSNISQN